MVTEFESLIAGISNILMASTQISILPIILFLIIKLYSSQQETIRILAEIKMCLSRLEKILSNTPPPHPPSPTSTNNNNNNDNDKQTNKG